MRLVASTARPAANTGSCRISLTRTPSNPSASAARTAASNPVRSSVSRRTSTFIMRAYQRLMPRRATGSTAPEKRPGRDGRKCVSRSRILSHLRRIIRRAVPVSCPAGSYRGHPARPTGRDTAPLCFTDRAQAHGWGTDPQGATGSRDSAGMDRAGLGCPRRSGLVVTGGFRPSLRGRAAGYNGLQRSRGAAASAPYTIPAELPTQPSPSRTGATSA